MSGRLSLSWVNKDLALVPADDGHYSWVDRSDPRVTEVRLMTQVDAVGDAGGSPADNLLIHGDSMDALRALVKTAEYGARYRGRVKLVYIDPPFNTGQAFDHYPDALEHSIWLGMMRERLTLIRELLSADGSVWVHLDDAEMAYCRAMMDEIFGRSNFVATVVWQKIHARNNSAQHLSTDHDYIIVFAKDKAKLSLGRIDRTELSDLDFWNPDNDPRGPWRRSDLTASHAYADGKYEVEGPLGDRFAPRDNRWWSCSQETFEALRADDRIWWGKTGRTFPFRKRFQSELGGLVPTTIWAHDDVGDNRQAKGEITRLFGRAAIFSTPKPEKLLKKILQIATVPGDVVLDCFAGSGTTAAVAHKMGRRWIAVEKSLATVETFAKPRLEMVVKGDDPGGISEEIVEEFASELPDGVNPADVKRAIATLTKLASSDSEDLDQEALEQSITALRTAYRSKRRTIKHWSGGGGFRHLALEPSMFERSGDWLLLAEWTKGPRFAEAVAAQLGFWYEPDGPFTGRRGRNRLVVLSGVADEVVIQSVLAALDEADRVTVVARGVLPGAEQLLQQLSPGSRLLKAPGDLTRRRDKVIR